ncbi:TetR/AcrR family transcriptional regulator [Blastococcus tunisiensis]|uniref:DNA-binding transcriptional regulator, AcrR family n=1 Tax=Blastococcus tunisiensis TaxID=1798228 RepID=A0A1I2FHR6_9ACTN|nr:TetR/AcrR family transcriptional regulator [Blastococcus sp. DSM 46838]SFF04962.1 DNA-binding transcriptional regulator, AcrR family [Blastococcus sp. DSM 46838]
MTETPDWRARRWAATHQRIYDAAIELFLEHGVEAVNVGQIARGADVSVPTFYAHYASKEHVLMQLPTAEEMHALAAALPADRPVRERLRHAAPLWFSTWSAEYRDEQLVRWKIIAGVPALRMRAAEFERATAGLLGDALAAPTGAPLPAAETVVVNAYLAAFTAGLLAWADCDGRRKLEELVDEAFDAL